jgi:hypothetical protein
MGYLNYCNKKASVNKITRMAMKKKTGKKCPAFYEKDWFFPSETTATKIALNCIHVIGTVYPKYDDSAGKSSQYFSKAEI